jgi:hypothetical protein
VREAEGEVRVCLLRYHDVLYLSEFFVCIFTKLATQLVVSACSMFVNVLNVGSFFVALFHNQTTDVWIYGWMDG